MSDYCCRCQQHIAYCGCTEIERLSDRIEELQDERDEALNQLDSARHSIEVLEANVARLQEELAHTEKTLKTATILTALEQRAALQDTATDTVPKTEGNDASQ